MANRRLNPFRAGSFLGEFGSPRSCVVILPNLWFGLLYFYVATLLGQSHLYAALFVPITSAVIAWNAYLWTLWRRIAKEEDEG